MATETAPEIDYAPRQSMHGNPVFMQLKPQNNSGTVTISLGQTVTGPIEFLLPPKVLNLSKTKISFKINIPSVTQATSGHVLQGIVSSIFSRVTLIAQRSNQTLVDISNFDRYINVLRPILT